MNIPGFGRASWFGSLCLVAKELDALRADGNVGSAEETDLSLRLTAERAPIHPSIVTRRMLGIGINAYTDVASLSFSALLLDGNSKLLLVDAR